MAESIQEILDGYIPFLQDYLNRNIFSEEEIKAIVARRRESEYLLRRREARKSDFFRYIEAEQHLEKLRKLRWAKIKRNTPKYLKKKLRGGIGDRHIISNINFIFSRMITKYKSDVELVLKHANFAKESGNYPVLSDVFSRALTIHPRNVSLWLEAASAEYFHGNKGNTIQNARIMMQRALRINSKSVDLWCGYARLEWHYATKLRGRRDILGGGSDKVEDDDEHGIVHLLRGAAPKLIFKQSLRQIPDSVELRMEMLQISTEFPGTEEFFTQVYESLDDIHMAHSVDCWIGKAAFAKNHPQRSKETYSTILEKAANDMPNNPDLFLRSLQFMEESLPSKLLIQQFEDFEEKNSDLYDYFSDYLIRIEKPQEALELLDSVPNKFRTSELSLKHVRLTLLYSSDPCPKKLALKILRHADTNANIELERISLQENISSKHFQIILEQLKVSNYDDENFEERFVRFLMASGKNQIIQSGYKDIITKNLAAQEMMKTGMDIVQK